MASQVEPEIILYDLACTKNVCFSPVCWRIRLMLNYKQIPYKTVFVEFPDIEPTLKGFGILPSDTPSGSPQKYTVPAIHHVPTKTYIMDSLPIASFLETHYPTNPVPLHSDLGNAITASARRSIGPALAISTPPRYIKIISPRSQEYYRRTREAALGKPLEELVDGEKEEETWNAVHDNLVEQAKLIRTNEDKGPFILGAEPSLADFFIAGAMQNTRVVDEGVFERVYKYAGFKEVYDACAPYMEKNT